MIPTVQRERPAAGRAAQSTPVLFVPSDVADLRASTLLAVHVLAQGPTTLTASVPSSAAATRALLLARAYGVADRLELRAGKDGHAVDRDPITVDASTVTPAELLDLVPEHLWDDVERPPETHAPLAGRRVAVITNVPIHHKVALLNAMATLLEGAGGTLHVLFTSGVPADRAWMVHNEMRFAYTALPSLDLGRPRGHHMLPRGLGRALDRLSPDIVVSAGFSPLVSGRAAHWCARHAVPFGLWSGEISARATAKSPLRRRQRRALMSKVDFGVTYGWQSARYLDELDPRVPVVIGRNTSIVAPIRGRPPADVVEVLAVSRAAKGKALDLVVEAARRLENVRLTVVGDGPELAPLRSLAAGSKRITFAGAARPEEVRARYAASDVFVFPSQYDLFGLVLVEAMGAGLPVITSHVPGAVTDLSVDGSNCIVVREPTSAAWEAALRRVAQSPDLRRTLARRAGATIARRWTIEHAAASMLAALRLGLLARDEAPL